MDQPEPASESGLAASVEHESRYRRQVERVFNRISLTGLPERDPRLNELPLVRVFVTLAVGVEQAAPLSYDQLADEPDPRSAKEPSNDRRLSAAQLRLRAKPEPLKLSIGEALHRYRRLVIVGAPGGGKTTLLRWLAVTFAEKRQAEPDRLGSGFEEPLLPVVLDLRRFAERFRALAEQPGAFGLADEASAHIAQDARFAGTPRELIREAITVGRCFILLDGLDEIADQATRRRVIEAVEAVYLDPRPGLAGNLCLLTTRPHGFASLSLGGGFQTATVLPFGRDDISAFIRNWYHIAYGGDEFAQEADELVNAVRGNERVEALAENPLLCTIITIVYRNNRLLPERRVELYFKCCEALLDTWERNKDIKSSSLIGGFSWQTKLELLAVLAYWMHGETERLAGSEGEIARRLGEALEADRLAEPGRGTDEARPFIETIRDRSGLLQGRGDGLLEFSHRTFQEYLAARHLATLEEEAMIDAVMPHLHEAWWQEVHLLLFGHIGSGKEGGRRIERLTQCILEWAPKPLPFLMPSSSPLLGWVSPGRWFPRWQLGARLARLLGRDLALAVRGYGQCSLTARTNSLTERLTKEIHVSLSRWRRGPDAMTPALQNLLNATRSGSRGSPLGAELVRGLLAALKDKAQSVRGAAARALGSAGGGDPAVVAALLAALKDEDPSVRWAAGEALGSAGGGDPAVVAALLAVLKGEAPLGRGAAAWALGPAAGGDPAVVTALLAALKDKAPSVRGAAARGLGSAAGGDPAVVTALLAALKDEDPSVRWAAGEALRSAGGGDPAAVAALLRALKDEAAWVQEMAARALGSAGGGDPAVVAALLRALKDENPFVRGAAAGALGSAGGGDPAVVAALLRALTDKASFARRGAARALGLAGGGDPAVVAALLRALKDEDPIVRWGAVRALGSAGGGNPAVVSALLAVVPAEPILVAELARVTEGRQFPGYHWRSLQSRRQRREGLRKLAIGSATGLALGLSLWFGASWFADLPETDPKKAFLKAVPAISTLAGLLWGLWQVVRGDKRTLWG